MSTQPVVAILDTTEDVLTLLSQLVVGEGFQPVTGLIVNFRKGHQDLTAFLHEHRPTTIIWDIARPYEDNWRYLQEQRTSGVLAGYPLVLTTMNKPALEALVGPTPTIELVGKPFDLDELVAALRRAISTTTPLG